MFVFEGYHSVRGNEEAFRACCESDWFCFDFAGPILITLGEPTIL